jgi:hypothetical protein
MPASGRVEVYIGLDPPQLDRYGVYINYLVLLLLLVSRTVSFFLLLNSIIGWLHVA